MQLLLPLASLAATALHLPVTLAVASSASYGSAVPSPELHSSSVPPIRVFGQAPVSALVSNSWDDALVSHSAKLLRGEKISDNVVLLR